MVTKFEKLFNSLICEESEAQNDYDAYYEKCIR